MKLIKKLDTRPDINGHKVRWAKFECSFCLQEVEKPLYNGLRDKSCSCIRYKYIQIIKICKSDGCNNKVKVKRNNFCSRECYSKSLIGHTFNKGIIRSEEFKKKQSELHKGKKQTAEAKRKQIEAQKGKKCSEETKQKISESNKGKKISDIAKQKMSIAKQGRYIGEANPNWNGGTSFEFYPKEFKQIRNYILERDNYTCQNINCLNTKKLHVHHIDYDKKNNNIENLVALCNECHGQTVGRNNRDFWIEYYQNIMIDRIVECLL